MICSIVEMTEENGLNLLDYLCHVSERMPNIDPKDSATIDELLAYSNALPKNCKAAR